MDRKQAVMITGASSGIGRALSLACARPGVVLHISGRDAGRLQAVADSCRAAGAEVRARLLDVTDRAAMAQWIEAAGRLDLVVANAGISAGTGQGGLETAAQSRAIFATNLDGMLNTALPALAAMDRQAPDENGIRGRLAVIASIAAFVAAPGAASYCASKAAADAWAVGTGGAVRGRGIYITSVCPGYVRSAMTAVNRFPMPGLMDAERAAAIILRGVAAGRRRVAFPWWVAAGARLADLLPLGWTARLLTVSPERSKPALGATEPDR